MRRVVLFAAALLAAAPGLWAQGLRARDSLDREVFLPAPPRRIVSLTPEATETLFGIGAGDFVVGVTEYCTWPAEAATRPKVGGYSAETISLERILTLRPDLVVSGGSLHASVRKRLEGLGFPVFVFEPANAEGALEDMELLGRMAGREGEADRLVRRMREDLAEIAARVASVPPSARVRVFWEVGSEPLVTCGARSILNDFITRAGGINVFGDVPASWPVVSSEEIVRRAPQVILAADDHQPGMAAEALARRPGWSGIPAVREGRIRFLPADPVSRTGPRMAQGVRLIARALYPELFP